MGGTQLPVLDATVQQTSTWLKRPMRSQSCSMSRASCRRDFRRHTEAQS